MRRRWLWLLLIPVGWIALAPAPPSGAPRDPWGEDAGFAPCASCHLADGRGRADGSVPSVAGQPAEVLDARLRRIADGEVDLPVMAAFAVALGDASRARVAAYAAGLPAPDGTIDDPRYAALCAGCHGVRGEGSGALLAPRLCGQHAPYLRRRLDGIAARARPDADPAMAAIGAALDPAARDALAAALGRCGEGA